MISDMKKSLDTCLKVGPVTCAIVGGNRSVLHAAQYLRRLGVDLVGLDSIDDVRNLEPNVLAVLIGGDSWVDQLRPELAGKEFSYSEGWDQTINEIWLWDYEVGIPGTGSMASAVSGVSAVIGKPKDRPMVLPAYIPEKWCGIFGASLAFSLQVANANGNETNSDRRRIDVSSADILRAWAEQNSGNHAGVPYGWRRNGRTAVEHGGVFPQGFFACKDGYIAIQARSRQDWMAILASLGEHEWIVLKEFHNPFKLSEDDSVIRPLLEMALSTMTRRELLDSAIITGAPMAPVLSAEEAKVWDVFRPDFVDETGSLSMPFAIKRSSHKSSKRQK